MKWDEVAQLFGNLGLRQDRTGLIVDRARALLEPVWLAFERGDRAAVRCLLPTAAVLGTAVIDEPKRADEIFGRRPEDDDACYNWAWPLTLVEAFAIPIPARGMQGFWAWRP